MQRVLKYGAGLAPILLIWARRLWERKQEQPITHFMPGHVIVLAEHIGAAEAPDPATTAKLLRSNAIVRSNDLLFKAVSNPPRRVLSFPRSEKHSPFSLIVIDVEETRRTPGATIRLVDELDRRI